MEELMLVELHSLLKRQLRRFIGDTASLPSGQAELFQAINAAYLQFDEDRRMLEHSLELTSQELLERNTELSRANAELEMRVAARTAELSGSEARFRGLFEHAPVSIWEEDFSAVRQYIDDLRGVGVMDFSAYFDAHPEAVAECAARVKIVDVNRTTLEMYQAESKTQLLEDLSKVLGPESLIPFKEELLALTRGDMAFENETINFTLHGERRAIFLRLTVAPSYEDTWAKVFVGISDITKRRQAEAALAVERDLLQALMDNIPDTIYFKDTASRFTRINRAQTKVLGVSAPEEAIGKTDLDFQDSKLAQLFYQEEQRIIETGEPLINRIEFNPTKDGKPRWFSATKVPIKDSTNRAIGIVGVSRDITLLRQAEDALREAEIKYRSLVERLPVVIYTSDLGSTGAWHYVSPQIESLLGFTPEEWMADPNLWYRHVHPDDRDRQVALEEKSHVRSEPFESEYRMFTRDNLEIWIRDSAQILPPHEGKLPIVQGVLVDITERKRTEEALHESQERFRSLSEAAFEGIMIHDHGMILNANQAFADLFGFHNPDELIGRNGLELLPLTAVSREMIKSSIDVSLPGAAEIEIVGRDGSTFPAETQGRDMIYQGRKVRIVAMRDITARKQAEVALRQSEERFRLMAWATKDAVWDWDLETDQIWWGAGLQKIFRYASETAQTDKDWWLDHIHPQDQHKVDRSIQQALESGMEFWSKEYRFRRVDGTYAEVMDRGYILRDDAGKPYRIIGAMLDITERKQDEETIRHQNKMLSSLHQITLDLLKYREINSLLGGLVELSAEFMDAPYVEIMLVEGERLVVKAATQNQQQLIGHRMSREDARLSWQAFDTREPAVLSDYANWPQRRAVYDEFLLRAVADFPILNDDQCLGVLAFGRDKPDYEFTFDQIQSGRLFANLTALVLNNAQLREALREQSIRDALTTLYNRHYMEEVLKQQLSRVTRHLHPLGIIMLDIDHFKQINDTYGHSAGDALLRELGQLLKSHVRAEDIACRYGGEEFILIMPDASLESAQQRAEYLRQAVKKLRVQNDDQSLEGITLSLGVAIYPEHGRTKESVLRAADAALYRAKQSGRDRVVVAERAD